MLNPAAASPPSPVDPVDAFVRIHVGRSSLEFAPNLVTRCEVVGAGARRAPVTVNDAERGNAWVCSPHTAYCDYATEELRRISPPLVSGPVALLCHAVGALLRRAEIDRAVAVNNWLLSTNLYPELDVALLRGWIREALERWPRHAVWFRSLNQAWTPEWLRALEGEGFLLVPSRQVYLFSDVERLARKHYDLRNDFKLLARTELAPCGDAEIGGADYARIAALYARLYLDKYSRLNPAYTVSFVESWHRAGLLNLRGFRGADGVLQIVVGMFERDGVLTSPLVGYDTALPQSLGLYRLAAGAVLKHAADTGKRVNLSAGVAQFKRNRGGVAAIEVSAVLVRHLAGRRRRAVRVLRWATTRVGVPLMRKLKL